jgi:hypothetical protein
LDVDFDPYRALGVEKTASLPDIRRAWRALAKASHPDLHPDDRDAERRFKDGAAAWALLSDKEARARYDRSPHRPRPSTGPELEALRRYAGLTREVVAEVAQVIFDVILPAYVERYDRGCSAELTWRLLKDTDDLRLLDLPRKGPKPGFAARQRAGVLRGRLRLRMELGTRLDIDGEPVLAELTLVQDRDVRWAALTVWVGSLLRRGLETRDDIAVALLPAMATEVVRALEADLPADLRVLAWRRRTGRAGFPGPHAVARRRDTRFVAWGVARVLLGLLCVGVAVWALIWAWTGWPPGF